MGVIELNCRIDFRFKILVITKKIMLLYISNDKY
jgi:hypothetical protein